MSYLIDANILLRTNDEDDPRHAECAAAVGVLRSRNVPLLICTQVLAEFWVVLTRPRDVNGWGLAFDEAVSVMVDARASFCCLSEPPDMADRWQQLIVSNKVMGKQAHDARIAALMLAHGVTRILTLNPGDFARYSGITAVTPREILDQ